MTEVKDQLAEALKILVLDCEGYEAWCRPVYAVDNAREALAAYEADKTRTSVNADGLVECLEKLSSAAHEANVAADGTFSEADFEIHYTWFAEKMAALHCVNYDVRIMLAEHQKGGK